MKTRSVFENPSEYSFHNDPEDFQMPYKNAGKFDRKVMLDKYNRLSNKPNSLLHTRFAKSLEDYG